VRVDLPSKRVLVEEDSRGTCPERLKRARRDRSDRKISVLGFYSTATIRTCDGTEGTKGTSKVCEKSPETNFLVPSGCNFLKVALNAGVLECRKREGTPGARRPKISAKRTAGSAAIIYVWLSLRVGEGGEGEDERLNMSLRGREKPDRNRDAASSETTYNLSGSYGMAESKEGEKVSELTGSKNSSSRINETGETWNNRIYPSVDHWHKSACRTIKDDTKMKTAAAEERRNDSTPSSQRICVGGKES